METIEQKAAQAILQQPEEITIGDKTFQFYPPSTATLILASEAISQLPRLKLNEEKLAEECLYAAKDCRKLGEIIAIFLLGAKHLKETIKTQQTQEKRLLYGFIRYERTIDVETVIDRKAELAQQLLEDLTPRELHTLAAQLLKRMQLADFFGLTTFLIEINLLRETKVEETTAFGQQ